MTPEETAEAKTLEPSARNEEQTASSTTVEKAPAHKKIKKTKKPSTKSKAAEDTTSRNTDSAKKHSSILEVKQVSKRFGDLLAVDTVSFEVPKGSIFGLVGPNGAGKTTIISMISGMLEPDSGVILLSGNDIWAYPEGRLELGVLPDRSHIFDRLNAWQYIYYYARLHKVPDSVIKQETERILEELGLTEVANRPLLTYSTGMKRKIALAACIILPAKVLILDEAFEGIDPVSVKTLVGMLREFVKKGHSVLFSSHDIELVEETCDSLAIVAHGQIQASGTMAKVRDGKRLTDRYYQATAGKVKRAV